MSKADKHGRHHLHIELTSEQYRLLAKRYAYKFTLLPCNNESEAIRNGRRLCNKR